MFAEPRRKGDGKHSKVTQKQLTLDLVQAPPHEGILSLHPSCGNQIMRLVRHRKMKENGEAPREKLTPFLMLSEMCIVLCEQHLVGIQKTLELSTPAVGGHLKRIQNFG